MLVIIENYGKSILICISAGIIFAFLFTGIRYEGKTGILEIAGAQAESHAQSTKDISFQETSYENQLKKESYKAKMKQNVKVNETIRVTDLFLEAEQLEGIRIVGVCDYATGEDRGEFILHKGNEVCFQQKGLYKIDVWNKNNGNVEGKQSYYISAD
ncbi:MAG: hypothetical protein K6F30_08465 [Lachnospiraceae bacterium]|nr:hypothetical protein [Lachnospiraceae bacterium]